MVDIESIEDLLCNIKDAMKNVFMPRDELNTTYSKTNHTHPVDTSLNGTSTNPVQNKVIKSAIDSLDDEIDTKADINHNHSDASSSSSGFLSSNLFTKLSNIATGATKNTASSTNPLMDGTANKGSETDYARGDHRHPTDTSRAPVSHASNGTGYGASSASNYGHSMASSTLPKPLGASANVGAEAAKFARGDHVHPLPAVAASNLDGLMSSSDKNKLDGVARGATVNQVGTKIQITSTSDTGDNPLITMARNEYLTFRLLTEFDVALNSTYTIYYVINGQLFSRGSGGSHQITVPAGDYFVPVLFKGNGPYASSTRTILLRVTA